MSGVILSIRLYRAPIIVITQPSERHGSIKIAHKKRKFDYCFFYLNASVNLEATNGIIVRRAQRVLEHTDSGGHNPMIKLGTQPLSSRDIFGAHGSDIISSSRQKPRSRAKPSTLDRSTFFIYGFVIWFRTRFL